MKLGSHLNTQPDYHFLCIASENNITITFYNVHFNFIDKFGVGKIDKLQFS